MALRECVTFDFETHPIGPRPEHYPPKPVGVAIKWSAEPSKYYAFGHPSGNNCTEVEARAALAEAYASGLPLVAHHMKFDSEVALVHWSLDIPEWQRIHDTLFLAFLVDPYARDLGLKQLGEIWLHMPKDEQDAVVDWILAHKNQLPRFDFMINKTTGKPQNPTKKNAGAWIAFVPADIVEPYANGDTDRTWKLFQTLYPVVAQAGMLAAYDRERQVMPIFQKNERHGLRVDTARLEAETELYHQAFAYVEDWLRWRLNSQGLNFDADDDVADALDRAGIVTEWKKTKTGKRSTAKDNMLPEMFNDPQVASVLGYRNRLKTCLKMFMEPWLKQATHRGGWISTSWNQVASDMGGTRTGRPSTFNPNFLNISKSFEGRGDGYEHPASLGVPELPLVRKYILADEGHVILKRDFSGQELRVFAHGSQGQLLQKYREDARLDVHHYVGGEIENLTGDAIWTSKEGRTRTKAMNFQGLYGGGIPALMKALRIPYDEAKRFKAFHDRALPDRRMFSDTLGNIVRQGYAIRTWGGRLYNRPPFKKKPNGQLGDADYILINYYSQGSAADATKEAMIRLHNHSDYASRFMLQVYDELNVSAPLEDAVRQMEVIREVMESIELRVPLLTDGEVGYNWDEMVPIDGSIQDALQSLLDKEGYS